MIRKWFTFNTIFAEVLKTSTISQNQRFFNNRLYKRTFGSSSSLPITTVATGNNSSYAPVATTSVVSLGRPISLIPTLRDLRRNPDQKWDSDDSESAVAETPARTELFEVKGPNGSAFLIEVLTKDLNEVRVQLNKIKGEFFHFDKTIIEWFTIKCILTAEPLKNIKDQMRLARIHAISSGSEEVYELKELGQFLFINKVDRTMRAKKILEKLGYRISGILYRFQPSKKIDLEDRLLQLCNDFVRAVERLPKVISVTHNL